MEEIRFGSSKVNKNMNIVKSILIFVDIETFLNFTLISKKYNEIFNSDEETENNFCLELFKLNHPLLYNKLKNPYPEDVFFSPESLNQTF